MRPRHRLPCLIAGLVFAVALLGIAVQQAKADDLATIKQRGTLIVGVKTDYAPFGFRSPSGEIVGIEPALAADVAKSLGVKLDLVPVLSSNRIQLLEDGKVDLIIATMNDTMLRRQAVDFVKPYYYAGGFNIMVPKSMNLTSWAELKGRSVCGVKGAYYNREATADFAVQLTAFSSLTDALAALKQGHCAGLLYDDSSIEGVLLAPEWSDYVMPLESREVQPWGLAVRKNQPDWAKYLSDMVTKWTKDGTIVNLETQYHIRHSAFAADAHQKAAASGN
jgi:polar amino acid transport system substrate-binding protein